MIHNRRDFVVLADSDELGFKLIAAPNVSLNNVIGQPAFLEHGARRVLVAAPVKAGALNIVMGVNDDRYDPATDSWETLHRLPEPVRAAAGAAAVSRARATSNSGLLPASRPTRRAAPYWTTSSTTWRC